MNIRPRDYIILATAGAVMLICGIGSWRGGLPFAIAAAWCDAAAVIAMVIALRGQATTRRRLAGLLGGAGPPRPTSQMLDALAVKVQAMEYRLANTHPVTRLPTREQLLSEMTLDLAGGGPDHLLGLIQFTHFDQLLAFDREAAHHTLACLGERISQAVEDRHLVSHVDRATFAIWFRTKAGRAEFDAVAYVAGQQITRGDMVLTPTLRSSIVGSPGDGTDAERLLARALAALATSSPSRDSEPCSVEAYRERFSLEQDLARAIEQEQLAMVFQPVVDLPSGRLAGAEALLRWDHPTLGAVSPARFIPMVEHLGLADRYGLWVLNTASREAARWRAEGLGHLRMAINVSAQQVLDPELETKIERTLRRHGLEFGAIDLELTETAAMANAERTLQLFTRLRTRGIGLAIDDFGTGYSSLSYLRKLPFTKLKIDREFVTDVDTQGGSRAICKALIELGRGLGLVVLAEGVETAAELDTLRALGCSLFQGYYFSRPLPGDAFVQFARQFRWRGHAAQSNPHPSLREVSA